MFMMRTTLLFLFGLALALPGLAQELTDKTEALILKTDGEGSSTNQVVVETGITGEMAPAPVISLEENVTGEASAPQSEQEKVASSTNAMVNAKLSFLLDTGIQYTEEGDYKDAERAYLRALKTDPDNDVIQFRLSTLYLMMDRYVEGVEILVKLVEKYPDNSRIRNNLAWAYATGTGVKNKKLALRHAREAILLVPTSFSMWNTLAEAYYMGGEYERALRASEHAIDLLIQLDPDQTGREEFERQRMKIQRAEKALKRFEGLDEDE